MVESAKTTIRRWFWRLYSMVMQRRPAAEDMAWARREIARIEWEQANRGR